MGTPKTVLNYQDYQYRLAQKSIIPLIFKFTRDCVSVLDVGCGEGGVSLAFAEHGISCDAIDLDAERLKVLGDNKIRIFNGDILKFDSRANYDVIILNDVIEHISDKQELLCKLKTLMLSSSVLYITTCSWYSPFAGHQQRYCKGLLKYIPYLHLLLNYSVIAPEIVRCKLTYGNLISMLEKAGFGVIYKRFYIIPPTVSIRFGIPSISFLDIPYIRELCEGVILLAKKQ